MLHLMNKLFEVTSVVVVLLLQTHHRGGLPLVVGPFQTVIVNVGDDVILPCHLEPAVDAIDMTVEWARPELNPRFVHVWHERQDHQFNQHQSYKGRTSVSIESLKHGNISLKLSKVKLSDNGTYRCYIPDLNKDSTVELVVDDPYFIQACFLVVTVALIVFDCCRKKYADLQPRRLRRNSCGTAGLYPDSITGLSPDRTAGLSPGSIAGLSPGSITGLSPGSIAGLSPGSIAGLYPDSIAGLSPGSIAGLYPDSIAGLSPASTTGLLSATSCSQRRDDLHAMMEQKKELENQKEQLEMRLEKIEREKEENKTLLESLEEKWNKTVDKQQLMREKENLSETRWKLDEKMKDTEKVLIETEKLLQIINAVAQRMSPC